MTKGKFLALDFGDKRVGVALSDYDKTMAFPREFLTYDTTEDLLAQIKILVQEDEVTKIILGLPIEMDGTVGRRAEITYEFGMALKTALPEMPVEFFDERLTTKTAELLLRHGGVKKPSRKGLKDSVAAQMILESYLNSQLSK